MSSRSTDFPADAMAVLEADHRALLQRFERVLSSRNSLERQQEWRTLSEAIKRHMRVEADVFYPAFLDATEDSLTHFVASVGHESIAAEMRDVPEQSAGAEMVSRIRSLKKAFIHHVSDMEAAGGMFDLARRSTMNQGLLVQGVRARYGALDAAAD